MKSFYVTTTRTTADIIRQEILRMDPQAALQYRRENKTLLTVMSSALTEEKLESIPGVAHACDISALGKAERVASLLAIR